MKKSRVASNALNNPKAGYSQLARLEPTAFERRSRRLQLTALEQLSKVLESKARNRPAHKKADTTASGPACLEKIPFASGWLKNIYQPDRENVARCSRARLQSHCQEIV